MGFWWYFCIKKEESGSDECFYGDEIVTLVVDGYGIYIDGQRYAVGEELANWTENLYNAAGVERYLD